MNNLTIIVPSYNDAMGLQNFLPKLIAKAQEKSWAITVVNDCSTDNTAQVLESFGSAINVITNESNMGYGAAIKRGIWQAETEFIATIDADGQHRIEDLEAMAEQLSPKVDAIIGKRGSSSHVPFIRMPGKWVLAKVANFITGRNIPDINCGLRIMRRDIMLRLFSITSDRFSFSTSTLICLLQLHLQVNFFPVTVVERIGKSTVNQVRDGFYTLMLILRLVTLFQPLRVFLPISFFLLGITTLNQLCLFFIHGLNIVTATVIGGLGGLLILCVALIADHISGMRRDLLLHDIKMRQFNNRL